MVFGLFFFFVLVLVQQVQTFIGLLCPGGPGRFGCSLQPDEHLPVEEGHLLAFGRGSGAPGHAKLGLLKVLDFMVLWFYYGLFHILILTYVYYISIINTLIIRLMLLLLFLYYLEITIPAYVPFISFYSL